MKNVCFVCFSFIKKNSSIFSLYNDIFSDDMLTKIEWERLKIYLRNGSFFFLEKSLNF